MGSSTKCPVTLYEERHSYCRAAWGAPISAEVTGAQMPPQIAVRSTVLIDTLKQQLLADVNQSHLSQGQRSTRHFLKMRKSNTACYRAGRLEPGWIEHPT